MLPLLALIVATLVLLVTILVTNITLAKEHIVGLVLLAAVITAQAFNTTIGYQATGGLLLIGLFALAGFTPYIVTISINIIKIDLFCLCVLFGYVIVHRQELPDWLMDLWYGKN